MSGKRPATTLGQQARPAATARERVLRTAYDLFSREGVQAVGVDRIVADAGVAKTTLYRHFHSKEELVVAVLERREERWAREWLQREVERRGGSARARLLMIFDVFDEWYCRADYEGCLFTKILLELTDRTSAPSIASIQALARIRMWLADLADEAGVRDPVVFAGQWQQLMWGSLVGAAVGDPDAAARARGLGSLLLDEEERISASPS